MAFVLARISPYSEQSWKLAVLSLLLGRRQFYLLFNIIKLLFLSETHVGQILHLASYKRLAALRFTKERGMEKLGLGVWDQQMQTIIHRMVKQQASIVKQRGLYSLFYIINHNGKYIFLMLRLPAWESLAVKHTVCTESTWVHISFLTSWDLETRRTNPHEQEAHAAC